MNGKDRKRREEEYKRRYEELLNSAGEGMMSKKESEELTAKREDKAGCSSCKKKAEQKRKRIEKEKREEEEAIKQAPSIMKQAANLTRAVSKHVAGGLKEVDFVDYAERLNICKECDLRDNTRCTDCGCFLLKKAWWRSEDCPQGKWKKQE